MVARKILFYQLRSSRLNEWDWEFEASDFIEHLNSLQAPERKHFPQLGNAGMLAIPIQSDEVEIEFPAIRYGKCRREGLALNERDGLLTPETLEANESRAEVTHVVFFEENVVGAEFSSYGLRPSSLAEYVRAIREDLMPPRGKLRVAPLYQAKTLDDLDDAALVSQAQLKFATMLHPRMDNVQLEGAHPAQNLEDFGGRLSGTEIEVIIRNTTDGLPVELLKTLYKGFLGRPGVFKAKATIRLEDDTLTQLNFLKGGHIGTQSDIELEGGTSGSVKADSAYTAIVASHTAVQDELKEALAVYQEDGPEDYEDLGV